jgi:hypothetical protein
VSVNELHLLNQIPEFERHPDPPQANMDLIGILAIYAVFEECKRQALQSPRWTILRSPGGEIVIRGRFVCAEIRYSSTTDHFFRATAWVPDQKVEKLGVNVRIDGAADRRNKPRLRWIWPSSRKKA